MFVDRHIPATHPGAARARITTMTTPSLPGPADDTAAGPEGPTRGPRGARWCYAVAGLLAALAGMAAGHLLAALVDPAASPVLAVGSTVVDSTPTPVKEWATSTFGTSDKPVLIGSVAVVTAVLAAAAGLLTRRRRGLGVAALLVLVVLAGAAALTRPTAGPYDVLPSLLTGLVGVAVLLGLARALEGPEPGGADAPEPPSEPAHDPEGSGPGGSGATGRAPSRRTFLGAAAGVVALSAGAAVLGQKLAVNTSVPAASELPVPADPLGPLPKGLGNRVPGISPLQTSRSDFYRIDTALVLPRVDVGGWRLELDGMVDHPFSLTWDELLAMDVVERDITLNCVSNPVGGPYISSARWLGVRTRDLLRRAGVSPDADQVLSTSTDGMTISTPVAALTDDRDAIVAIAMNGQPLPRAHGFPARLVTPGLFGFVGATKWLTRLTATTYAKESAYWTDRGWAIDAPVTTQSRIDTPRPLSTVDPGTVMVGGVAWAQERGIEKVEVRVDDGPWRAARLGADVSIDYWRQWYLPWKAEPGRHTLTVRATDGSGRTQTDVRTDPFPSGATGWHSALVTVGDS